MEVFRALLELNAMNEGKEIKMMNSIDEERIR